MSNATTRGHVIMHTAAFIQQSGPSMAHFLDGQTSMELRTALDGMSAAGSYPRRYQTELMSALAAASGLRTDAGYSAVRRCGAAMLSPQNMFSVLLLKVLTPELFINKLARFWARDHGYSGNVTVESMDAKAGKAVVRLSDVAGYDFIGVFWHGFIEGMLRELAKAVEVRQSGFSWDDPGPRELLYEVEWS